MRVCTKEVYALDSLRDSIPESGWRNLVHTLRRAERGNAIDFRTPLYDRSPRAEIARWLEETVLNQDGNLLPELWGLEEAEKSKVGPLSLRLPFNEIKDTLEEYWQQDGVLQPKPSKVASAYVRSLLPTGLRPLSLSTAYEAMPKGTSLGLPWASSERKYTEDYLDRAECAKSLEDIYPAILYHRGQAAGPGRTKQRHVWGMDHVDTILGLSIMRPLLAHLVNFDMFAAWRGPDDVDDVVTRLFEMFPGNIKLSIDYKGFDHSLPSGIIDAVFDIIIDCFQYSARDRINLCRDIFKHVGMATPDGVWTGRRGGVPSGTALTNMVDSLSHVWIMRYLAEVLGTRLLWCTVMGDDGIHLLDPYPGVDAISEAAKSIGMTVSPEKQTEATDHVHYLQRQHHAAYVRDGRNVGVRSLFRTLSGLTGYERLRSPRIWSGYMDTARWIMQAENCKHHPNFKAYVRFIRDGDRILTSGMSPAEVFQRAGGAAQIRRALSIEGFPYPSRQPELVAEFRVAAVLEELRLEGK